MRTNETKSPGYMLLFSEASPETYEAMSQEQRQHLFKQWTDWYDGLAAQGKLSHGHPLQPARRVISGDRGERIIDGPFAEGKEAIGGYFFLTVDSLDEATAIAMQCPSLRYGITTEIRQVAPSCPILNRIVQEPAAEALASA